MATKTKKIKLRSWNLIDARADKGIKKWKLFICRLISVPVLHKYQFIYSVSYYNGKIEKDDVIVNQQGIAFLVATANSITATIIMHEARSEQPQMKSTFHILAKNTFKKDNNNKKTKK